MFERRGISEEKKSEDEFSLPAWSRWTDLPESGVQEQLMIFIVRKESKLSAIKGLPILHSELLPKYCYCPTLSTGQIVLLESLKFIMTWLWLIKFLCVSLNYWNTSFSSRQQGRNWCQIRMFIPKMRSQDEMEATHELPANEMWNREPLPIDNGPKLSENEDTS